MANKDIEKYEALKRKKEEKAAKIEEQVKKEENEKSLYEEVVTQDYDIEKLSLDELKLKYDEEKNKLKSIKDELTMLYEKITGNYPLGEAFIKEDEFQDSYFFRQFFHFLGGCILAFISLMMWSLTKYIYEDTYATLSRYIIPLIISILLSIWAISLFKSLNVDVSKTKKLKNNFFNKRKLYKNQEALVNDLLVKIKSIKGDSLNQLINSFQKEFDVNSDKTVDIIQHDNEFKKLINTNQEKIINFEKSEGRDFIRQFVQLANFLNQKEKELQSYFTRVSDISILERFDGFERGFKSQIQFYNVCRINSIQMVTSFINDDRVTFYDLYEKFDKFGVFNSHFQNQLLSSLNLLNANIGSLVDEIRDMSLNIESKLDDLISTSDYNADLMNKELNKLGSKIDVSNTIGAINTYQNYQTKKRLK